MLGAFTAQWALLRIPSTERRSVCLCWAKSTPKGPQGHGTVPPDSWHEFRRSLHGGQAVRWGGGAVRPPPTRARPYSTVKSHRVWVQPRAFPCQRLPKNEQMAPMAMIVLAIDVSTSIRRIGPGQALLNLYSVPFESLSVGFWTDSGHFGHNSSGEITFERPFQGKPTGTPVRLSSRHWS